MKVLDSPQSQESGFVLVLLAISMLVLLLMLAFAVDLGSWYLAGTRLQRAADSAALAGAAVLPDTAGSQARIAATYSRNGYTNGINGIAIETSISTDNVRTTVNASQVPTHFLRFLTPSIKLSKQATAERPRWAPSLGSPFSVLGTGDLTIPGIPKQNFWLAINAQCDAKEDGDFFAARYDGNKGPFTANVDSNQNYIPTSTARHHCPLDPADPDWTGVETNTDRNPAGYSYYVAVPPPPLIGGTVTISVYDGAFHKWTAPDSSNLLPADYKSNYVNTAFHVWDTKETMDDEADDVLLKSVIVPSESVKYSLKWVELYTAPYNDIAGKGRHYRVEVATTFVDTTNIGYHLGTNAFALGAFRSWDASGCDSRESTDCPQVYARNAISVFNNLSGSSGSTVAFYLASMDASFAGRKFYLFLWDPGEGVNKLELLAPDGTPLKFNWKTSPTCSGCEGTSDTSIITAGTGPQPGPNRSNNYRFNDRLLTLEVGLPATYATMINDADGDTWLRLRYTLGSTSSDRTTWGISMGDDSVISGPPRLLR